MNQNENKGKLDFLPGSTNLVIAWFILGLQDTAVEKSLEDKVDGICIS